MSVTSYDVVSYACHPWPQTHPDRLVAIGTLLGLAPAPFDRCRVLELGGGDGSNLIPMGLTCPHSTFVGYDLAETAVAEGTRVARALHLKNVQLHAANLLNFPADAGPFDYILAHGLYSWVPGFVRDKMLAICRDHLSPQGIAYISYNALPGFHIRRMLRDIMRFHVRDLDDPQLKIDEARSVLSFLSHRRMQESDPYAQLLAGEINRSVLGKDPSVLYHDDLAEINDAFYFHEFMTHAAAYDLQFLAEADYAEMSDAVCLPDAACLLRSVEEKDPLLREQYLDFLKCRRFRQTLLVRKDRVVDRHPSPERIRGLSIASKVDAVSTEPDLANGARETFRTEKAGDLTLDLPLAKAALLHLRECYPLPVPFDALVVAARARPGMPADGGTESDLAETLLACFARGVVELHAGPAHFARRCGPLPACSPLARWQLQQGRTLVTTLRHTEVRIDDELSRVLLLLMDGSHDRAALLTGLVNHVKAHPAPDQSVLSTGELRKRLNSQVSRILDAAAEMGLLMT